MNPLFEKYFFGELTDSEESALEDHLVRSEQAAWEFGQQAEEVYNRYGLPPLANPPFPQDGMKASLGGWGRWLVLLLLLLMGAFWWFHRPKPALPVEQPKAVEKKTPAPVKKITVRPTVAALPTAPPAAPPGAGAEKETGNNLRVVVNRETPGAATIRVLNAQGQAIRLLYSGNLGAGKWAFEWDGRSGEGRLVDPGKYLIEVLTDGVAQSKVVNIR
jgi:hypothetical protein